MNNDYIDDATFLLYTARNYDNPQCHDVAEFYDDLRRIKYIKKLITRYEITGELKERLILNHLIILNNVFGPKVLCKILFLKMFKQMEYLKPFLLLLNVLPPRVSGIGPERIEYITDDIPMDQKIVDALRKI